MFLFLSIVIAVHGGSLVRMFGKVVLTTSDKYDRYSYIGNGSTI